MNSCSAAAKRPVRKYAPRQGLADRALGGLERAGLLERDHGRVGVVVREEAHALGEGGVCVVAGLKHDMGFASLAVACSSRCRFSGLPVVQPNRIPDIPGTRSTNVADFSPFAGVRYTASPARVRRARGARRSTLRRHRRRPARRARGRRRAQLGAPDPAAGRATPRAIATTGPPRRSRSGRPTGVLAADPTPRFYAYRMEFTDPHGVRRHTRGVLGALTPARAGRRRRPPPRAHAAEGEVRPARAAAGDAGQRRPDLGPDPRLGPHRAARRRHARSPRASTPTACATRSRAIDDPARSPRSGSVVGERAARAGRRAPPVRDRAQLPQRAARPPATRSSAARPRS